MSKAYQTTSSSLFLNENQIYVPNWIENVNLIEEKNNNDLADKPLFEKTAAFADNAKVNRDDRDYNSREIDASLNDNKLVMAAKIELAKFLSKLHYSTQVKFANNNVELITSITNVPATFSFKYIANKGRIKSASLFTINLENDQFAEYPFNKAGFNECLDDLKANRVKTATKAPAYKAYTITLAEIVRRFNGDQRAAMDKVRELVASQDIIGVETNTFATCYAIDSLFPKMQKEAGLEQELPFEFVNNKEHVAAKPNANASTLMTTASKQLHTLFDDFKINSFERKDNNFIVQADVLLKNKLEKVAFNFNIIPEKINGVTQDKIEGIAYCNVNNQQFTLPAFLEENQNSNILDAYLNRNNVNEKKIYQGIILTKDNIINKLRNVVDKDIINDIINNWAERDLIKLVNSNTYISQFPFTYLLNQINTKLLTDEEIDKLYAYSARVQNNLNRIDQLDNIRDGNIVYSPSIRLANLYNKINNFLDNFVFKNSNKDCTRLVITNFSERGPEDLLVIAEYDENKCIRANIKAKKHITAALKNYKKINKNNVFAKSVITESTLKNTLIKIFKNPEKVANLIKQNYLQKIGNNFYVSKYPLSAIVNSIDEPVLTEEERKEILNKSKKDNFTVNANYEKDLIRNSIDYSRTIRLASVYNVLSKKIDNFSLNKYNKDCSKIELNIKNEQGIKKLTVTAQFDNNKCIGVNIPAEENDTEGLKLYKLANKNNIFANSIFSKKMLLNVFSNIFSNPAQAADAVLTKIAKPIGNNFYASKYPLSAIINSLAKHNYQILSKDEKEELNKVKQYFGKKITASYIKDTGTRLDTITIPSIRLANLYQFLAKQYDNFNLSEVNKNVSKIKISQITPIGLVKHDLNIEYKNNIPVKIACTDSNNITENKVLQYFQNEHGKQTKVAKAVFSRNMLRDTLKSIIAKDKIESSIDKIITNTEKLPNDFYASDKPLSYLINNNLNGIETDFNYIPRVNEQVNRNEIKDTGTRQIEFTESLINAINQASVYLNKYFKDFKFIDAKLDNETLYYRTTLFDKTSGLKNDIEFNFKFKDRHIIGCNVNVESKNIPIEKVKQAFASNDILNKYLKYNNQEKTNSPIIISTNHLINKLTNLVNSKNEIYKTLNNWRDQGKITKIANNAYVSNYTLEQLISMSSLKALSDEEIKKKLMKKHNLLKVSSAYIKDTGNRKIEEEWNIDKYIQFVRNGLNTLTNYSRILNANIKNDRLIVLAELGLYGTRHKMKLSWDISEGRPKDWKFTIPSTSDLIKRYTAQHRFNKNANNFNNKFNIEQLENNLLGYIDKQALHKACEDFVNKEILTKQGNTYYAKYSIPEILALMERYGYIDEEKAKQELIKANKQQEIDTAKYKQSDASRKIENNNTNEYFVKVCNKLKKNIILAADNKLITARKKDEWLNLLSDINNMQKVHKEFIAYLQ